MKYRYILLLIFIPLLKFGQIGLNIGFQSHKETNKVYNGYTLVFGIQMKYKDFLMVAQVSGGKNESYLMEGLNINLGYKLFEVYENHNFFGLIGVSSYNHTQIYNRKEIIKGNNQYLNLGIGYKYKNLLFLGTFDVYTMNIKYILGYFLF